MIVVIVLFWYVYDDALAAWLNCPWLGDVPFIVWVLALVAAVSIEDFFDPRGWRR